MKKILLVSALLIATASMAADYDYEFTPQAGYVITEDNLNIKDHGAFGAEFQFNNLKTALNPELSLLYSPSEFTPNNIDTDIFRIAINGVREYGKIGFFTPLTKIGLGYETMSEHYYGNEESLFADAGVGAKIPFNDNLALKLEAVYMAKFNDFRWDNNLALLAGLNFAFGDGTKREEERIAAENARKAAQMKAEEEAAAKAREEAAAKAAAQRAAALANADDDHDGVRNKDDKCPNTPKAVTVVDHEGCMKEVNLEITFDNASYNVSEASQNNIKSFATFLKYAPNYSAKIVGYTDSVGQASKNKVLSLQRANAVKGLLVKEGIAAKRITTQGMGEADPIASNDTKEGRAKNRRIEAVLEKTQ